AFGHEPSVPPAVGTLRPRVTVADPRGPTSRDRRGDGVPGAGRGGERLPRGAALRSRPGALRAPPGRVPTLRRLPRPDASDHRCGRPAGRAGPRAGGRPGPGPALPRLGRSRARNRALSITALAGGHRIRLGITGAARFHGGHERRYEAMSHGLTRGAVLP